MQLFTIAGVGFLIFREVTVDYLGLAMFLGEWSMLSKSGDFYQAALTKFGGTNTGNATYSSFWMQSRKFSYLSRSYRWVLQI